MPPVPEKVLAWLFNVLQAYPQQQRAYSDIVRVLQSFPSLNPRTEVYTYDSGASDLLLTLNGTLPVTFRGTTYNFPVKLWIPKDYPQEAPIAFVVADRDLQIRAGQHVSVDGRIYHPYLSEWSNIWDRASVAEFLEYLQQAFAKEPPVISRAHQQQYQRPLDRPPSSVSQNAGPSLPPKQHTERRDSLNAAPPRPPKPGDLAQSPAGRDPARDGPPLPPLPEKPPQRSDLRQSSSQYTRAGAGPSQISAASYQQYRPQEQTQHRWPQQQVQQQAHGQRNLPPAQFRGEYAQPSPPQQHQTAQQQVQPQHYPPPQRSNGYAQQPVQKRPAMDLLSDPFDIALPAATSVKAPPIPPNPEKEHLLQALSATCIQQAQQKVNQNYSAFAPLQAQQHALRAAHARLEAELNQLEALDKVLASNEAILHRSIQDCDRAIVNAKSKPQPAINDVLIAPTLVAQQLWSACAEEAACREAMYALQKAVDRGRISGVDFVRQMRGLGRECFFKMALARKCAQGLGLEVDRR